MPAPPTVNAAGYYQIAGSGSVVGEALLRMRSPTKGTFTLGGLTSAVSADPATKTLKTKHSGLNVMLKIKNRNLLAGSVGTGAVTCTRNIMRPIPAAELAQADPGPPAGIKAIMDATPDYLMATGDATIFWHHFGNLFYRGRLDGSARVLCIASDPGPTECLPFVRRSLVGDSGQKTQGFLDKLGLKRSYVLVNAFTVAMRPSAKTKGLAVLSGNAAIKSARHDFYNALFDASALQAIVAFGEVAHQALDHWKQARPSISAIPHFRVAHPAAVDRSGTGNDVALKQWVKAVSALRNIVTPDADSDPQQANFGSYFTEADYVRIPRLDLPGVAPLYVGDDSWGRAATPRHNNCCKRPAPDDRKSLLLTPPPGQGQFLAYRYLNGQLAGAKNKSGQNVAVDAFGIEM